MSKVRIMIEDIDLNSGEYRIDFSAEGSEIDDGVATAAYMTAYFLYTISDTQEFINSVGAFAEQITTLMIENHDGPILSAEKPAKVFLTLEDADLTTGRYDASIEFEGGHPEGDRAPSSALAMGVFMRSLLTEANFHIACWEFAKQFADEHGAVISNISHAPADSGEASAA